MHLSFTDINIWLRIINIYLGTWVGLFVLKAWSLHMALLLNFTNVSMQDDTKLLVDVK